MKALKTHARHLGIAAGTKIARGEQKMQIPTLEKKWLFLCMFGLLKKKTSISVFTNTFHSSVDFKPSLLNVPQVKNLIIPFFPQFIL